MVKFIWMTVAAAATASAMGVRPDSSSKRSGLPDGGDFDRKDAILPSASKGGMGFLGNKAYAVHTALRARSLSNPDVHHLRAHSPADLNLPVASDAAPGKTAPEASGRETAHGSAAAQPSNDQSTNAPHPASKQQQDVDPDPPVPGGGEARFSGNKVYMMHRAMNSDSGHGPSAEAVPDEDRIKTKLTYYWIKYQRKGVDEGPVKLRSCDGKTVHGTASKKFAQEIRMEGTGHLLNGKMINLGDCNCGDGTDTFDCFDDVTRHKNAPFGYGVENIPLRPLVSVANNDEDVKVGTVLYVPALDGLKLPNGKVHNGCLQKVDHIGRGGREHHIDFFAVNEDLAMDYIDEKLRKDYVDVEWDAPRCRGNLLNYGITPNTDFDDLK